MAALAVDVDNAADFKIAVANGGTIELTGSFELGEKITIAKDTTVNGNGYTITRKDGYEGTLLTVNKDITFVLDSVTLDGGNEWTLDEEKYDYYVQHPDEFRSPSLPGIIRDPDTPNSPYLYPLASEKGITDRGATDHLIVVNGKLTLQGATIKNSYSVEMKVSGTNAVVDGKSVICANANSEILIKDSTIRHCAGGASGTVVRAGGKYTCTISGNTLITDNFGGSNGGLLHCCSGSTVILEAGSITGNRGVNNNGSVIALHGGTGAVFEMKGGIISDNTGIQGVSNGFIPVIYCHSDSTFKMTGGTFTQDVSEWLTDDCGLVQQENGLWTVANEEDIFTITYAINEGTMPAGFYPTSFVKGTDYELPTPTRNSFTFLGWTGGKYTTPAKTVKVANAPAGNAAYTANWQDNSVTIPATGDESNLVLWFAMLLMGAAVLVMTGKRLGQAK